MADPPRPAPPHSPRVQDLAKAYARDVLPTGAPAPAAPRPPPAPAAPRTAEPPAAAGDSAGPAANGARRVKDLARELAPAAQKAASAARDVARDVAHDLAEGVRRSSRHVRMRAAIVATWAALSVASFWIACPSSGPTNDLGAEVKLGDSFLGTQILVRNESGDLWTDVVLTLDGGWSLARKTVRPGDEVVVAVAQFSKDGAHPPKDLRPERVTIECAQGRARAKLARR